MHNFAIFRHLQAESPVRHLELLTDMQGQTTQEKRATSSFLKAWEHQVGSFKTSAQDWQPKSFQDWGIIIVGDKDPALDRGSIIGGGRETARPVPLKLDFVLSQHDGSRLKEQFDAKLDELNDLRKQIAEKKAEILEKQRALEQAQKSKEDSIFGSILGSSDSEIAGKARDLSEALKQLEELQKKLKEVGSEIEELLQQLQKLQQGNNEELDPYFETHRDVWLAKSDPTPDSESQLDAAKLFSRSKFIKA